MDTRDLQILDEFPFACTVGLVDASGPLLLQAGGGGAPVTSGAAAPDPVRALASVSKPITALGVLVAIARGLIDLEDPAGPPGATVRHLLSHSAGCAFDSADVLAEPGARRIYSNVGFELLGEHLAEATGRPVADWLEETVVQPLGLGTIEVEGSPAKDFRAGVRDLLAIGQEFLAPTLIPADLAAQAVHVQMPGLSGVLPGYGRQRPNDWGLGVEIRGEKSPHWTAPDAGAETFGHFGQSGSFLWVDPRRGIAGAFLGDRPFGPVHMDLWPRLSAELLTRAEGR